MPKKGTDKNEETIKRLKVHPRNIIHRAASYIFFRQALVVACGTRKVWSKVFENTPKPTDQIKLLKSMLEDLGMKGRLSLEQAKVIKEKNELAKEIGNACTLKYLCYLTI